MDIFKKSIVVLIPCLNEEKTIQKVIRDWKEQLPDARIYVYDNHSSDNTAQYAREAGAIVRYVPQRGKGNVVKRMFDDIEADCYIMVDGDDTYSADNARYFVESILEHKNDMVIGDRLSSTYFTENTRRFHDIGNRCVRFFINLIFQSEVTDIMTGCRAFSYRFIKTFPVVTNGFEIETEMTIHALDKKMPIDIIPVEYKERSIASESKLQTLPDGFRVLKTIFSMFKDYRPLQFFFTISLLFFALGSIFVFPVFLSYLQTGLVERFPTLIACGFAYLTAVISFFSGLILDSLHKKEIREFELLLLRTKRWF